jgi:hypothetical protein
MKSLRWHRPGAWWILPAALFLVLVVSIPLDRTSQLWDLDNLPPDIVRLTADGSASQASGAPPGAIRGFAATVNAEPESDAPITVVMRIREYGGVRTILRESTVEIESAGYVEIDTGLLPPLVLGWGTPIEYEIQIDANSSGSIAIVGSLLQNHPAQGLTINGAPTLPQLRASISPVVTLRTISLLRAFISWRPVWTPVNLVVAFMLSFVGMVLLRPVLTAALNRTGRVPSMILLLASAIPATGMALIASTISFDHSATRYYMQEVADAFWAGAFAYLLLWIIGITALKSLFGLWRRARSENSGWSPVVRHTLTWRSTALIGLTMLALAVPMALLRAEDIAQFLAGTSVVLIVIAIIWRGITLVRIE